MSCRFQKVVVYGPGLLGGSLASAVSARGLAADVAVWGRREEAARAVVERGWATRFHTDAAEAAAGADLIILATPVGVMPRLAAEIVRSRPRPELLVTDVGSVKGFVSREVAPIFEAAGLTFIGSHPMAGGETAGLEAARADLFEGAACILTPHAASLPRLRSFWEALGCRVVVMPPAVHDEAIARISHLPHVAASAIVLSALGPGGVPSAADVTGRGFRDTTRIAGGDPGLWTEILLENRDALRQPLEDLRQQLGRVLDFLERRDEEGLRRFLSEAKELRDLTNARAHG